MIFIGGIFVAIYGAFISAFSPFAWIFWIISGASYLGARALTRAFRHERAEWTVGLFWVVFWASHILSERAATRGTYPCGYMTTGQCPVVSSAGFPFVSLHYFGAGDEPLLSMWPVFFLNAGLIALACVLVSRWIPAKWLRSKMRYGLLVAGLALAFIGQGLIALRFD